MLDSCDGAGDLAGNERLATPRRLVVEENAAGGVKTVGLAVVDRDAMAEQLGTGVRAARVERRGFGLGRRCRPEHLARGSLVEPAANASAANRFEQSQGADGD